MVLLMPGLSVPAHLPSQCCNLQPPCVSDAGDDCATCAVQAFVTKDFLAVVTEHGEGGLLSEYLHGHSSEAPGVGIKEEVARCADAMC